MYCVIVVGKYVHAAVLCKEMALLREEFYAHVRHTFGKQVYNELDGLGLMKENFKRSLVNEYSLY